MTLLIEALSGVLDTFLLYLLHPDFTQNIAALSTKDIYTYLWVFLLS